jgi:hypothetical protein
MHVRTTLLENKRSPHANADPRRRFAVEHITKKLTRFLRAIAGQDAPIYAARARTSSELENVPHRIRVGPVS